MPTIKTPSIKNPQSELQSLRVIINKLDELIAQSVARRMSVVRTIGAVKKQNKIKIKDRKREKELREFHRELAENNGVTYKTLKKIFALIIKESKKMQK